MAHQYLRNMLDSKMTVTEEFSSIRSKQELDLDDLTLLIENCRRLAAAAQARCKTFEK